MNLRPALLAFAVVATLAACGKKEEPAAPVAVEPAAAPEPPPTQQYPAGLELARFRGQAVMGKDGYGLTVCGDTRQLVVGFTPEAQATLDGFLKGGAKEFFLDGWGTTDEQARPQFNKIERVYTEGPGCDEKDLGTTTALTICPSSGLGPCAPTNDVEFDGAHNEFLVLGGADVRIQMNERLALAPGLRVGAIFRREYLTPQGQRGPKEGDSPFVAVHVTAFFRVK
jgi:hypothetical protein